MLAMLLQDGPPADSAPGPGGGFDMLILLGGMFFILWLVVLRPEKKERKKREAMIAALKKNDRVLTTGGMYATVAAVHDSELTIKFDDGPTRVRVLRTGIASVLTEPSSES